MLYDAYNKVTETQSFCNSSKFGNRYCENHTNDFSLFSFWCYIPITFLIQKLLNFHIVKHKFYWDQYIIWIEPIVVATDPTNKKVESNDQVFPCKQLLFISSYVRTVKFITKNEVIESLGVRKQMACVLYLWTWYHWQMSQGLRILDNETFPAQAGLPSFSMLKIDSHSCKPISAHHYFWYRT